MQWYVKGARRTAFALLIMVTVEILSMSMVSCRAEELRDSKDLDVCVPMVEIDVDTVRHTDEVTEYVQMADSQSLGTISGSVGSQVSTYDTAGIETGLKQLTEAMGLKGSAAVTEVFSLNNRIKNCYYKPCVEEIYMLEEYVMLQGDMASAYTGFFDLTADSPYTGNQECRELEILGYDFLLAEESYDGSQYHVKRVEGAISKQTAVMDIYKALGIEIQQIQLYHSRQEKKDMVNSPAVKNLPWLVNDIDASRGRTDVFITRTNPLYYVEKAKSDLHWNDADVSSTESMTLGEFIVRVADMMDLYGEPVISQAEMNVLLQVFGGNIPTSLTGPQRDAYVYLRSRGILTDEYQVFSSALTFKQMIEILMRVKDVDSRQNLKEIQVTMDISDSLINKGFFPKNVILTSGTDAIQIAEDYDYTEVTVYDYFISVDGLGFNTNSKPYIPIDLNNPTLSSGFLGASVLGYETINGGQYVHVKINAAGESEYFNGVQEMTGLSTAFIMVDGSNPDRRVVFEQGGGIYTTSTAMGDILATNRLPFDQDVGAWAGYVDKERSTNGTQSEENLLSRIVGLFKPISVKAADPSSDPVVEMTIFNWSNVDQDPAINDQTQLDIYSQIYVDSNTDTAVLKMNKSYVDTFRQNIKRKADSPVGNSRLVIGIAQVSGNTLVPVKDLVEWGLVYEPDVWDFSDGILVLDTQYGRVILNQNINTVVAGTTLYKIAPSTMLFTGVRAEDLMVDFRAVYGWSANIADITMTGTGDSYSIGIAEYDEDNKALPLKSNNIEINKYFRNDIGYTGHKALFIPSNVAASTQGYLMVSNYQFANWIAIDSYDPTENAVYVFYPKAAFTNAQLAPPDDIIAREEIGKYMVYNITENNNWVVRKFPLDFQQHDEAGKITYIQQYGYVYNVPLKSDFDYTKYLKGECILPLYFEGSGNKNEWCWNANVNIWGSMEMGKREYGQLSGNGPPAKLIVDWEGNTSTVTGNNQVIIQATPAGVQSLFGGVELQYADIESGKNNYLVDAAKNNSNTAIYFGTSRLTPNTSGNGVSINISKSWVSNVGPQTYSCTFNLDNAKRFYEMVKWKRLATDTDWEHSYISFGDILETKTIEEIQQNVADVTKVPIEVSAEDYEGGYGEFDKFSMDYLLRNVDKTVYWILIVTVKILPMLMIISITIMMGLSFMSDNKIVQKIIAKTFDPIKFLTFGHKSFSEMSRKRSLISLMVGYLAAVLIADGNVLKVIMFLSRFVDAAANALRNL